jgi:hypothetical protein
MTVQIWELFLIYERNRKIFSNYHCKKFVDKKNVTTFVALNHVLLIVDKFSFIRFLKYANFRNNMGKGIKCT